MKKNFCFMMLVVVFVCAMCVYASAADNTITASGFYDITEVSNVLVVPMKGEAQAETVSVDVDGDSESDVLYVDSDRLAVTYTAASDTAYYGVVLVKGSAAPTDEDAICYINQATATSSTIKLDVYPLLPTGSCDMTLYISSNVETDELVAVPLKYTVSDTFSLPVTYITGDINSDGVVDIKDAASLFQYSMLPDIYPIS